MSPFETIGMFYALACVAIVTVQLVWVCIIGLKDIQRRYQRGKNEEAHDLITAYQVKHQIERIER